MVGISIHRKLMDYHTNGLQSIFGYATKLIDRKLLIMKEQLSTFEVQLSSRGEN